MYRRYEPSQTHNNSMPSAAGHQQQINRQSGASQAPGRAVNHSNQYNVNQRGATRGGGRNKYKSNEPERRAEHIPKGHQKPEKQKVHPVTKFIPQSIYNPETGKIFGFLSAEDLLIAAIILILLDGGSEDCGEDNSILIYALLYILISEHVDLPI